MHKCDVTINTAVPAKGTGDETWEGSDPSKAVIAGGSETDMRFGPYMNDVSRFHALYYFCVVIRERK